MTTPPDADLRTTLHLLAESTTPLPVEDGLWQRGQAARRRGQALAVAAVLTLIVSVGGIATVLTTTDREARTASTEVVAGGAIPSTIVDIPDDLDTTTDLALGQGSVAFISATQEPVLITATDGVPRRLALPGWVPDGAQALALSPDGRRLAWQAGDDEDTGRAVIGVVELGTGVMSRYELGPDARLRLRELSWSPDSTWVAWIGDDMPSAYVGRLRPGSIATTDHATLRGNIQDVAVDSDGTLVLSRPSGGLFGLDETDRPVRLTTAKAGAGRFSPDGRHLALRTSPLDATLTLDTTTQEVLEHPFPADTFAASPTGPLGWLDNRLQLLMVRDMTTGAGELVVTTSEVDDTSTWRRSVGSVDPAIATTVSMAVDLVPDLDGTSSQQLTHDFGDPLSPDGRDISWMIGLGVAAAIAVLLGLRLLWRRLT